MENKMNIRPWITDEAFISPWAYEALQGLKLPNEVTIYDVTLRDGEQFPGMVFRKDDKIRLAQALDELGIKRIEVGMPAVGEEEVEAIKEIVKRVKANVTVLCRAIRKDVDLAADAGVWGVVIEVPANEILIKDGFLWEKEEVIQKVVDTCNYAKSKGLYTICFLVDSSGADPAFLKSFVQEIVSQTNINSIVAVDTFGRQTPQGVKLFFSGVSSELKVIMFLSWYVRNREEVEARKSGGQSFLPRPAFLRASS